MGKLRVGFIGVGDITDLHYPGYKDNPKAELYAICDVRWRTTPKTCTRTPQGLTEHILVDIRSPFLATFIFEFSESFLLIFDLRRTFIENGADWPNFTTNIMADGDRISTNMCSERPWGVRVHVLDLPWPRRDHFSQLWLSSFHNTFLKEIRLSCQNQQVCSEVWGVLPAVAL